MNTRRSVYLALFLFLAAPSLFAQNRDVKPSGELLPGHVYTCAIVKSYSGNDGTQPIPTRQSEYEVVIAAGPLSASGLAVSMRISHATVSGTDAPAMKPEWEGKFNLRPDGEVTDITITAGELGANSKSYSAFVIRKLFESLFNTVYSFMSRLSIPMHMVVTSTGKAAQGSTEVIYKLEEDPGSVTNSEMQGMLMERDGKAVFNETLKCYTHNELREVSRITVPPTDDQKGKEVIIVTTTVTTVKVK
jgi:hypothetical protein